MRVAIIGGGISGLSVAYYLRKMAVPVSQITIYEASDRLGGWIHSKTVPVGDSGHTVCFERGPRTLRLGTLALKELNTIQLANELGLEDSMDIISKEHPAAKGRYIYSNDRLHRIVPKLFSGTELIPKPMLQYMWREFRTPTRDPSVHDESIWSFVARRSDASMADNLVDPVFKGICGGDIKRLSARSLLTEFYGWERTYGSIVRGVIKGAGRKSAPTIAADGVYADLHALAPVSAGQAVLRMKGGMQQLTDALGARLAEQLDVRVRFGAPVERLQFGAAGVGDSGSAGGPPVLLRSDTMSEEADLVVSSLYANDTARLLPDEFAPLSNLLSRIESVNMAVVNFYFSENVLPVNGFGYLVPTSQRSPLLGCIFDSVFNDPSRTDTVLTVMLGGAWYNEYIGARDEQAIADLAYTELRKQLNLTVEPKLVASHRLKNAIPQYLVGHQALLDDIEQARLDNPRLANALYLSGNSYSGVGINDTIFAARQFVERTLSKHPLLATKATPQQTKSSSSGQ